LISPLLESRAKILQKKVHFLEDLKAPKSFKKGSYILGDLKTPKFHPEIN
jgi:hypothetical protein